MSCKMYPILQKTYSSFSHLSSLNPRNCLFENIHSLDSFFSEFRNITFVAQKSLETEAEKKLYKELRDKYLITDQMKWFKDKRNETTKQAPFKLQKQISVSVFSFSTMSVIAEPIFNVDNEIEFSVFEIQIQHFIENNIKTADCYYSIEILLLENGIKKDLYEIIKAGLFTMQKFVHEIDTYIDCTCKKCTQLRTLIEKECNKFIMNHIQFSYDYHIENGKLLPLFSGNFFFGDVVDGFEKIIPFRESKIKFSALSDSFKIEIQNDLDFFYRYLISTHIFIYQEQNHEIVPTLFILFDNNEFSVDSFLSSSKGTLFRKINAIAKRILEENIRCVMLVNEFYQYKDETIFNKPLPYNERILHADTTVLSFSMIDKNLYRKNILFDASKIDDNEYVKDCIEEQVKCQVIKPLSVFTPIAEAFIKKKEKR
jgi:hypothetical protein